MNRYIFLFFAFSFLGWVWESIYCTICHKKWANRGFLYGPICPIYGFGGILGLGVYDLATDGYIPTLGILGIFIAGFAVSMILEYPTSWILEKFFHARWWDYSNVPLNINGRTSVPTSIAFGVASILVMEFVIPFADGVVSAIPEVFHNIIALLLVAVISVDATLTVTELTDFHEQVNSIDEAFQEHMTNAVDKAFDKKSNFKLNAASRVRTFKFSERKNRISKWVVEQNLDKLKKEFAKEK